jgi:hypothetical protein
MNIRLPSIKITYTGDPMRVDPDRITDEMFVPNLGFNDPRHADDRPGEVAARLFIAAEGSGALVIPDGVALDCYGDHDDDGGGFMLVAYPRGERGAGVTCGWRDVRNIVRLDGDTREDNDPEVVKHALSFMAAEINVALKGA